jgi:hypothetical protein
MSRGGGSRAHIDWACSTRSPNRQLHRHTGPASGPLGSSCDAQARADALLLRSVSSGRQSRGSCEVASPGPTPAGGAKPSGDEDVAARRREPGGGGGWDTRVHHVRRGRVGSRGQVPGSAGGARFRVTAHSDALRRGQAAHKPLSRPNPAYSTECWPIIRFSAARRPRGWMSAEVWMMRLGASAMPTAFARLLVEIGVRGAGRRAPTSGWRGRVTRVMAS